MSSVSECPGRCQPCPRSRARCQPCPRSALSAIYPVCTLYDVDARADGDLVTLAELRRTESVAVLAELKEWLWSQVTLKSLSIGKAAGYAVANWDRLTRFVHDARIPLDNNATERAIRGPVVGRKNHYGSKSRRGTQVAATLYTVLETCSRLRNCTASIPLPTFARLSSPSTAARCCCRGSSPPRATRQPPRSKSRGLHHGPRFKSGRGSARPYCLSLSASVELTL